MNIIFSLLILFLVMTSTTAQNFLETQKNYPRVKIAYKDKLSTVETLLMSAQLNISDLSLYLRIFKKEKTLEVWAKAKKDTVYHHLTSYPLCATSGQPGPKRMQGDEQMPEGIYKIVHFNAFSNFFLSMKIDYPNASDLKLSATKNPGGDIFIHGNCVAIGCFPIGDEAIKELYILAIEATAQNTLPIPVHIFPCKMTDQNTEELLKLYPQHEAFWKSLQPIYQYFDAQKKLPLVRINSKGYYEIAK